MRQILIVAFLGFVFLSYGQKRVHFDELLYKVEENAYYHEGKLFSGLAFNLVNNFLEEEGSYLNGKKDGITKIWFHNSDQIWMQENYKNGELNGISRSWYRNGNIKTEEYYDNGLIDSLYKQFHENGKLYIEVQYKNGMRNGYFRTYYTNGQLYSEDIYKKGKHLFRKTKCWDIKGNQIECEF